MLPTVSERFLEWMIVRPDVREEIVGDLNEVWLRMAEQKIGKAKATIWLYRQLVSVAVAFGSVKIRQIIEHTALLTVLVTRLLLSSIPVFMSVVAIYVGIKMSTQVLGHIEQLLRLQADLLQVQPQSAATTAQNLGTIVDSMRHVAFTIFCWTAIIEVLLIVVMMWFSSVFKCVLHGFTSSARGIITDRCDSISTVEQK